MLGEFEDVHPTLAVDDPQSDRRMAQGIERLRLSCGRIDLDTAVL